MDLRQYHGKRICVLLEAQGRAIPACGEATYEQDDEIGGVLRITLESSPGENDVDIIIAESQWQGDVTTDSGLDCDFCFVPAATDDE